ncbi:hypothetical protein [Streptomyces sp. NPDC059668]|uniref:hypothetical protein n=1 Tax=Streptomyces sp. NPDC059668 TaxID=3346900 RepID=UPI0036BC3B7F
MTAALGSAQQEAEELAVRRRYGLPSAEQLDAAITAARDLAAEGGRHPLLAAWMASPSGAGLDEQFRLSLDFLIEGVARRLNAPEPEGS